MWWAIVLLVVSASQPAATADKLKKAADAAARRGDWPLALTKAEAALAIVPGDKDALTTATLASCHLQDQQRANQYASQLRGPRHDIVKKLCDREGVTVP